MKIFICNYEYPPLGGGGGVTTKRLAEELAKRHAVTVLTSSLKTRGVKEVVNGVELYRVPVLQRDSLQAATFISMAAYLPSSLLKGLGLCKQGRFDIINSHFAIPTGPSGVLLAKFFGIPHVLSIHGGDIYDPSKKLSPHKTWGLHRIVQAVMNSSDKILAQSKNTKENAELFYTLAKPVEIIPHAIERPRFNKKERSFFGFTADDMLLITTERLIPRKAVHQMITIMTKITNQKIKLLVLGDGPERGGLEKQAASLGLTSRVYFKGWVSEEEKFQLLSVADIYVSSSMHEGFGLNFCEAMACGLPIISYDNGGHTDFLKDGQTGYLAPVGNLDKLCEKVTWLCARPDLRSKYGAFNKLLAERFYIEECAAAYEKVFEQLVRERQCWSGSTKTKKEIYGDGSAGYK